MTKKFKATVTKKQYAESQIQKYLNEAIVYECQKSVIMKTLADESKKVNAVKAISALDIQIKAGKEALEKWKEFYKELENK